MFTGYVTCKNRHRQSRNTPHVIQQTRTNSYTRIYINIYLYDSRMVLQMHSGRVIRRIGNKHHSEGECILMINKISKHFTWQRILLSVFSFFYHLNIHFHKHLLLKKILDIKTVLEIISYLKTKLWCPHDFS